MPANFREYLRPIIITLLLLIISFLLHNNWCGSPMNAPHEHWQYRINTHLNAYPFSIRYLTTQSTIALSRITSLPYRESFYLLQFSLALLLGPIFFRYLRGLGFTPNWSNLGVVMLMSAYPIMAAHFEPVHTWDDFWTYIFLIMTFFSITSGKLYRGALFFILACFSREQTLIWYPLYCAAIWLFGDNQAHRHKWLLLALPGLVYMPFFYFVHVSEKTLPLKFIVFNFKNFLRARDSLFSLFVSFGFIWLAALVSIVRMIGRDKSRLLKLLLWGGIYMGLANTLLTLFSAMARETRLFFPPFIFFIPLTILAIKPTIDYLKTDYTKKQRSLLLVLTGALIAGGIFLAHAILPSFEYRQCPDYGRTWAGVNIGIIAVLLLIWKLVPVAMRPVQDLDRSARSAESSSNS